MASEPYAAPEGCVEQMASLGQYDRDRVIDLVLLEQLLWDLEEKWVCLGSSGYASTSHIIVPWIQDKYHMGDNIHSDLLKYTYL